MWLGQGLRQQFASLGKSGDAPPLDPSLQSLIDRSEIFEAQGCIMGLINQGLFDNANFVLTPNGYKAGKLYALKPDSGDLDVTWARNGSATRINKNGLIESVGNDVPRLDYLAGNCPSILVEEQRTNIIEFSDDFQNSYWNKTNITLEESTTDSIILGKKATLLTENNLDGYHLFSKNFTTDSVEKTLSIFIKKTNSRYVVVSRSGVPSSITNRFIYDFDNNEIIQSTSLQEMTPLDPILYANGWVRLVWRQPFESNFNNRFTFGLVNENEEINSNESVTYLGNGERSVLIEASQIEEGSSETSSILTAGSAVTRPADAPQPITVPSGTTEIVEAFEDGTFNTITTIPATYTIPFGRFKYILFNGA